MSLFTVEQLELIRRLRVTGMKIEQIVDVSFNITLYLFFCFSNYQFLVRTEHIQIKMNLNEEYMKHVQFLEQITSYINFFWKARSIFTLVNTFSAKIWTDQICNNSRKKC